MDRSLLRRRGLLSCLSLAALTCAFASASPAEAQQVIAGKGAVTIDLGVLNQLGQPVAGGYAPAGTPTYPGYSQPIYGQQPLYGQPYAYGQPGYAQTYGGLQFPPPQYPVSSLMVQPPAGSTPYVPSAAMASAPAMTAPAASAPASATTTNSETGTPPPAPSATPTTVPMDTATSSAPVSGTVASTSAAATTTTDTSTAATTGTEATSGTSTSSTGSSAVPAATPLTTTEATTGTAATGTAATGTTTTGTETTAATTTPTAPATTGSDTGTPATASGTAASGTATTGTTGTTTTAGTTQTASVPPAAATEGEIRIAFPADSADIPDSVKAQLNALAQKMASDDNLRIQLLAYASGTSEQASRARRMSLSRALAVRSYLIQQGVRSTRMDVRALGNNVEGSPADRVDILTKAQ